MVWIEEIFWSINSEVLVFSMNELFSLNEQQSNPLWSGSLIVHKDGRH